MKVSTDGVLLGAWSVLPNNAQHILDIGTGSGILALMIAQRAPHAHIDAIEPDEDACKDALFNFQQSPWASNLHLHCAHVQHFAPNYPYEAIVCNPPYFRNSLQATHPARNYARHNISLTLEDMIRHAHRLLCPQNGVLSVILPFDQSNALLTKAAQYNLYPTHSMHIKTTPNKPFTRLVVALARKKTEPPHHEEHIVQQQGTPATYTSAHLQLTKDFYLFA